MTSHDARMSELQARVQTLDASLADLDQKYNELASRFDGDPSALMKEANIISTRIDNARKEKALMLAAAGQLELKRQAEQEEQERESDRRKRTEAKQIADQIMAAQVDLDRQLVLLREAFERRAILLRALANTAVVDQTFVNRLLAKGPITAAMQVAGLHRFCDLHNVATVSIRTLASSNSILLGIGKDVEPAAPPVQRRRLSNGGGT
jgi:hypothetical protein